MEARLRDHQIILPIGTAITFKMIGENQQKIDLKITETEEPLKFFALFDKNDVDFEIEINNSKCIHGIGYTLIVNNGFYDYYIGSGEVWSMEALYTRGRKLHFISENSEKGQNVIKQTAEEFDITYSESANVCSKIEFNFEVEKVVPKKPERLRGQNMGSGLSFGSSSASYLMSGGNDVIDSLAEQSTQGDLSPQLMSPKGRDATILSQMRTEPISKMSNKSMAFCRSSNISSLAKVWNQDVSASGEPEKPDKKAPKIGEKGVVCFGEQSNQYYNPYKGFTKDSDLTIKPFVVELRFSMI